MKKLLVSFIILFLSCTKSVNEGCLDEKAVNYNKKSEDNCCCYYKPKIRVSIDSSSLDSLKKQNIDTFVYYMKDSIKSNTFHINDLLVKDKFVFESYREIQTKAKLEVEIRTNNGRLLFYKFYSNLNAYDDLNFKIYAKP